MIYKSSRLLFGFFGCNSNVVPFSQVFGILIWHSAKAGFKPHTQSYVRLTISIFSEPFYARAN